MTSRKRFAEVNSGPRFGLMAAAALSGLALAGCGSGSAGQAGAPAASATSAVPGGSSPSAQPSATPATPGGPMATATAGSAAECSAADLKITYTDNTQIKNGALDGMSHADSVVMFTNVSTAPCRTQGYPGVAALDAAGNQVRQAARQAGQAPLITLRPGQVASAEITGNTASCPAPAKVAGFLVTAPDQRTSTRLGGGTGAAGSICLNSLGILPLQPGNAAGLPL